MSLYPGNEYNVKTFTYDENPVTTFLYIKLFVVNETQNNENAQVIINNWKQYRNILR